MAKRPLTSRPLPSVLKKQRAAERRRLSELRPADAMKSEVETIRKSVSPVVEQPQAAPTPTRKTTRPAPVRPARPAPVLRQAPPPDDYITLFRSTHARSEPETVVREEFHIRCACGYETPTFTQVANARADIDLHADYAEGDNHGSFSIFGGPYGD